MADSNYFRLARSRAQRELQIALKKRQSLDVELNQLNVRIEELRKGLVGLNALCGDSDDGKVDLMVEISTLNLSDAVRTILGVSELHLTPLEIRRNLFKFGYQTNGYTNPLASIHTILKRLEESGAADTILKDGKVAYRLKSQIEA